MRISRFAKSMLILVATSLILAPPAFAIDGVLNLPSTLIRIEVSLGAQSYFDTKLSEVASGYDVTNATYRGWCVDVRTKMALSPATHAVFLYSSTNPPGQLANEAWDLINYILNHKQGSVQDIQQAIWYFMHMSGNYTPTNPVAWTIINDTLENGNGFVPTLGETVAVICYPTILFPGAPDVQVSIIELTVPSPLIGDVTGPNGQPDGKVDMRDVGFIGRHFGDTVPPAPSILDLYPDGKIDMHDIGMVTGNFGQYYP